MKYLNHKEEEISKKLFETLQYMDLVVYGNKFSEKIDENTIKHIQADKVEILTDINGVVIGYRYY
ncbi:MAG: hypothetical protein EOL97_13530 [Spirochaetia bacterium]|nr:hypothetical protein [Spirochaetia bacterium]